MMLRRGLKREVILRLLEASEKLDNNFNFEDRFQEDFLIACTKSYGLSKQFFKHLMINKTEDEAYRFWLNLSDTHDKLVDADNRLKVAHATSVSKYKNLVLDTCLSGLSLLIAYYSYYGIKPESIKSVDGMHLSPGLVIYFKK